MPVGARAFRQNLLGAAVASAAAVLAGALATSMLRARGTDRILARLGGAFAIPLWGLSDAFWWQAGIGDKYPLLCLLFVAVLWTAWRGRVLVAAFVFGLAVTHHPFGLFAAPALLGAAWKRRRLAPILLLLICLPLSLRVVSPPLRAVADMNWGDPVTARRMGRYLTSGRYHGAVAQAREAPGAGLASGAALGFRLLREELTIAGLLLAAAGAAVVIRSAPGSAAALAACVVANIAFAVQTPEKVVRWYGPTYGIVAVLAGIGWAGWPGPGSRWFRVAAALGVVLIAGWQGSRGASRNDLSSFYAAHDQARNLLTTLPHGAVYLGRGDDDLFPLWAARFGEGLRSDVEAVGLGTPVDVRPADAGGLRRLSRRVGFAVNGWEHLHWLLTSPRGIPVRYARTGYDDVLWTALRLQSQRSAGLTAERTGAFDGVGSPAATRRAVRAYRWRGWRGAPAAALLDQRRPRDEIARDALLQYVHTFATLAVQLEAAGHDDDARAMYENSARLLEYFVGPLPASPEVAGARASVALGFSRLASIWERRGVAPVAARFRTVARRVGSPPG